ncbi:MAG TPA: hypothetical protein VGM39_03645 [Kofleriaceae bacterium]
MLKRATAVAVLCGVLGAGCTKAYVISGTATLALASVVIVKNHMDDAEDNRAGRFNDDMGRPLLAMGLIAIGAGLLAAPLGIHLMKKVMPDQSTPPPPARGTSALVFD